MGFYKNINEIENNLIKILASNQNLKVKFFQKTECPCKDEVNCQCEEEDVITTSTLKFYDEESGHFEWASVSTMGTENLSADNINIFQASANGKIYQKEQAEEKFWQLMELYYEQNDEYPFEFGNEYLSQAEKYFNDEEDVKQVGVTRKTIEEKTPMIEDALKSFEDEDDNVIHVDFKEKTMAKLIKNYLIKMANKLDKDGFITLANKIDLTIKKIKY